MPLFSDFTSLLRNKHASFSARVSLLLTAGIRDVNYIKPIMFSFHMFIVNAASILLTSAFEIVMVAMYTISRDNASKLGKNNSLILTIYNVDIN